MRTVGRITEKDCFLKVFICLATAVLVTAVWLGTKLPADEGMAISVFSPFEKGTITDAEVLLLLPELVSAALLTLPLGRVFSSVSASAVFAVHGMAIGHTVRYCAVNSVDAAAIGVGVSYSALTLMMVVYAVFMREEKGTGFFRLLCYLTVSGAAIILRIVPFLFMR